MPIALGILTFRSWHIVERARDESSPDASDYLHRDVVPSKLKENSIIDSETDTFLAAFVSSYAASNPVLGKILSLCSNLMSALIKKEG